MKRKSALREREEKLINMIAEQANLFFDVVEAHLDLWNKVGEQQKGKKLKYAQFKKDMEPFTESALIPIFKAVLVQCEFANKYLGEYEHNMRTIQEVLKDLKNKGDTTVEVLYIPAQEEADS
jgi:hypothetical protein